MTDDILTFDTFTPHVGKRVRFRGTDIVLEIDRVEQGEDLALETVRAPFSVIFRGPRDPSVLLREGLYDCEVEDGGPSWNLYVMPIHTPQRDRQEYQAVFN
jgi:hypothetical protein